MSVRLNDCLTERSILDLRPMLAFKLVFSRIRSKITIALFKEYPMIVSRAAIVVEENSSLNRLMKVSIINTS
ncbi:MAG: hypothetical protein BWY50_02137 [Spirochaetes bacterium ADurb.Bin315]|nr:MAG: hypothetical protein BWY50_02137 [Spirochaetes bacterium ADurb.Bin315]